MPRDFTFCHCELATAKRPERKQSFINRMRLLRASRFCHCELATAKRPVRKQSLIKG